MYPERSEPIDSNSIRNYLQYHYGGNMYEPLAGELERRWNNFLGRNVLLDLFIYPGNFNLVEEGLYLDIANHLRKRGFRLKPQIPLREDSLVSPSGRETRTYITTGVNSAHVRIVELNRAANY